jgi:UDP-N-acetyl-D-glucosamine dehydrogenase
MYSLVSSPSVEEQLAKKITSHTARVGVVGLGYVGLPLAVEFAKAGFTVTGINVQQAKVDHQVNAGRSYIQDVPTAVLEPLVESGELSATADFSAVESLDTIDIYVPTRPRKTKDPDMSYVVSACEAIAKQLSCWNARDPCLVRGDREQRRSHCGYTQRAQNTIVRDNVIRL